jgi:transcriptional regulator with XRE-family HTH domain
MSSAFSRRFVELVEQYSGGNKRQFAELTGKSPSHIYRICRGLSRPSMAYLEHIHGLFALDFNWLLTGERVLDIPFGHNSDDLLLIILAESLVDHNFRLTLCFVVLNMVVHACFD